MLTLRLKMDGCQGCGTLTQVPTVHGERGRALAQQEVAAAKAQREWQSAIATLEPLLLKTLAPSGSEADHSDPLSTPRFGSSWPCARLEPPRAAESFSNRDFYQRHL
jgi:hypothetical protein